MTVDDGDDFVNSNFHAQQAGFDFGGIAVEAAEDDQLDETSDANPDAGLQQLGTNRFLTRCRCAEIGL